MVRGDCCQRSRTLHVFAPCCEAVAGSHCLNGGFTVSGSCGQVRAIILDALRHWAAEYDVDGFCFVNAENMAQGARATGTPLAPLPLLLCDMCRPA